VPETVRSQFFDGQQEVIEDCAVCMESLSVSGTQARSLARRIRSSESWTISAS
jgi:hypothetical protein